MPHLPKAQTHERGASGEPRENGGVTHQERCERVEKSSIDDTWNDVLRSAGSRAPTARSPVKLVCRDSDVSRAGNAPIELGKTVEGSVLFVLGTDRLEASGNGACAN